MLVGAFLSACLRCAASLARKVYMRQNLGVGILRNHYGGRNKRKVTPRFDCSSTGGNAGDRVGLDGIITDSSSRCPFQCVSLIFEKDT